MPYRFYRRVRYRNPRCIDGGANFGTDAHTDTGGTCIDVVPNLPKCSVPLLMRYRAYRRVRYRHYRRTELTEVSGIGIDVIPNLPKCPVPVLMYRTYRSCSVPVVMLYRTYRSVWYRHDSLHWYRRYRYLCRTELTEESDTGITGGIYRRYASARAVPNTPL